MKEHKTGTGKPWVLNVLLGFFIALTFLALAGLCAYAFIMGGAKQEYEEIASVVDAQAQSTSAGQAPTDAYASLQAQNPDFVGWVELEDTTLRYPVVQTPDDPQYYLRRDFNGNDSLAGVPFLDARCDMEDGTCLIVYGHNMNDGSMFAPLQQYLSEEFWTKHPVLRCDSMTQRREYAVMAVLHFADSQQAADAYYRVPETEEEFTALVENLRAGALYDTGVEAAWGEQLLLLSTCDRYDSNARILVAARLLSSQTA